MTKEQSTALEYHCRLACETAHPRFAKSLGLLIGSGSQVLTVNSGWE